jgi:glycosyltransferase involved in cell wall biosynthesis
MKKISIVTPTYQSGGFLKTLLQSCVTQEDIHLNHIFCDNCSTDDTASLIAKASQTQSIIWSSEKDSGPAQAINRGFSLADSEIIAWINADDYYASGAIDRAWNMFEKNPSLKFIYGKAKHVDLFGDEVDFYPTIGEGVSSEFFMNGNFICQPTIFFKKDVLEDVGYLDENLKTAFDFDWFIRIFKKYSPMAIGFIDDIQAYSRLHDQCLTKKYRQTVTQESIHTIHKYFGNAPVHWLDTYAQEIFERFPFVDFSEELEIHIQAVVQSWRNYFAEIELNAWLKKLNEDARIRFSKPNLFLTIEPDGWVKDELLIKVRFVPNQYEKITLYCDPQWPFTTDLHISITSLWDQETTNLMVSSREKFILEFELPDTSVMTQLIWKIRCDQTFVPAVVDPQSEDGRQLSLRVLDLKCS